MKSRKIIRSNEKIKEIIYNFYQQEIEKAVKCLEEFKKNIELMRIPKRKHIAYYVNPIFQTIINKTEFHISKSVIIQKYFRLNKIKKLNFSKYLANFLMMHKFIQKIYKKFSFKKIAKISKNRQFQRILKKIIKNRSTNIYFSRLKRLITSEKEVILF